MENKPSQKPEVTQMVKKFPSFVEPASSLPCSQKRATDPHPKSDASSPQSPDLFL